MSNDNTNNEARIGLSLLNAGLGQFPTERTHIKTEVWWLIEADSPAVYMAPQGWITNKAWDAYRFESKRGAEAFLESQREFWARLFRLPP